MPSIRVLLVEDEFLIRLILAEALGDAGFAVTEAADGEEAIALLEQNDGYDLLITDIQMPGRTDGIGVALHARNRFPDLPIVFATARLDSIRGFGKLREREAFVQKPYGPEQMIAVIRRMLESG